MLSRLRNYLKSSFLSLPLSVVVCFSPLPPLTTVLYLAKLGAFDILPKEVVEPEELRRLGYAPGFVRLYEEVLKAQRTGRRETLKDYLKERVYELKTRLELMDMHVRSFVEVSLTLSIAAPLLFVALLVLTEPRLIPRTVTVFALTGVGTALLALRFVPLELWLRNPHPRALFPLALFVPIYLLQPALSPLFSSLGIPHLHVTCSLVLASALTAAPLYLEERRAVRVFDEALELTQKASHSPNPIMAGVDLDTLLDERFYGVAKAVTVTLYVLFVQGGRRYFEAVASLLSFAREYIEAFRALRKRALVALVYAVIMSAMAAAAVALLYRALASIASLPTAEGLVGFATVSQGVLADIAESLDLFIALTSLTYAVSAALTRDGNPLYTPLYLFPVGLAGYAGYVAAFRLAPLLPLGGAGP